MYIHINHYKALLVTLNHWVVDIVFRCYGDGSKPIINKCNPYDCGNFHIHEPAIT